MQPETDAETDALVERWHAEIRLLIGGTEHVIATHAPDGHAVLDVTRGALDALGVLDAILSDDPDAPAYRIVDGVFVHRHLWRWRITWTGDDEIQHVAQSWTPDGAELWADVSDAVELLLDLRELLRQTRRRPPRPVWDEQLAAYDAKAAASALSDAELEAHMATRRPPGTPG